MIPEAKEMYEVSYSAVKKDDLDKICKEVVEKITEAASTGRLSVDITLNCSGLLLSRVKDSFTSKGYKIEYLLLQDPWVIGPDTYRFSWA